MVGRAWQTCRMSFGDRNGHAKWKNRSGTGSLRIEDGEEANSRVISAEAFR